MTFFSLIAALLLEQAKPLGMQPGVFLENYFGWIRKNLTTGESRHGTIAWLLAVIPLALAVLVVHALLHSLNPVLAWLWNVSILYLTMGFRQFSGAFTRIERALKEGDIFKAREILGQWRKRSSPEFSAAQVSRVAIEQGMIFSHRYVFGVIFWFSFLGPMGAVLYRLSSLLVENWSAEETLGKTAKDAHALIDWIPVRLTAISFAVVGDFEDALYCWRTQAKEWRPLAEGILLASGAGAVGVRLGEALPEEGYRPSLGLGDEADPEYMQSTVGLVWRSLVLWMLFILLLTLAHLL